MSLLPPNYGSDWNNLAARLTALRNLGFQPRNILDVGAYQGFYAGLAKHVWPAAELFLIEANEDCRPQLTEKGYPFEIALLDATEREAVYHKCTTGCGEGNGLYKENSNAPFAKETRKTQRLDDVVVGHQFDFVKLDCQGAELDILEGGQQTLSLAHVVQLETQAQAYNERAPRIEDVILYMARHDFRVFDIIDFHYNRLGMLIQTDILFVKANSPLFGIRPLS